MSRQAESKVVLFAHSRGKIRKSRYESTNNRYVFKVAPTCFAICFATEFYEKVYSYIMMDLCHLLTCVTATFQLVVL